MAFDFENGSYTDAAGRTVLDPAVYKDWQIGAAAEQALPPVDWFRRKLGLLPEELLPYGKTPKLDFLRIMERLKDRPDGKYIEVTAITPTPLGEGKSTTSLGLIEGLGRLGANVGGCLRQPSGGPTMNVKGTAAGGGNALLIPMTEFSLGLTGDINDIMNAHNLAMTVCSMSAIMTTRRWPNAACGGWTSTRSACSGALCWISAARPCERCVSALVRGRWTAIPWTPAPTSRSALS